MVYVSWPSMKGNENVTAEVFLARGLFESAQDLDCRFYGVRRPYAVTDVLARCLKKPTNCLFTNEQLWLWTLPQRLQGLLAIVIAGGHCKINALEHCSACGETNELELDLDSFVDIDLENSFSSEPETGVSLVMAIPTGRHQLEWLELDNNQPNEDRELTMATTLVQTLNGEPPPPGWRLPRHWLDDLQATLEEHDPLTAFDVAVNCPDCSETMKLEPDLEDLLLTKLESLQKSVLEEVYYLARAYHWTEAEIFNMPAWRRHFYVQRCQQEM